MGVSLYLVWSGAPARRTPAFCAFGIQLALNALWSVLFFGLRSPLSGFVCIAALWLGIAATTAMFYSISRKASALLLPCILWVSFAAVLNMLSGC